MQAMAEGGKPPIDRPSRRMLPLLGASTPMLDRSVVVLPAPLRPSSATTSPCSIRSESPNKTWEAPYSVLIRSTSSRLMGVQPSEIGVMDRLVAPDFIGRAVRQKPALVKHGNALGQLYAGV